MRCALNADMRDIFSQYGIEWSFLTYFDLGYNYTHNCHKHLIIESPADINFNTLSINIIFDVGGRGCYKIVKILEYVYWKMTSSEFVIRAESLVVQRTTTFSKCGCPPDFLVVRRSELRAAHSKA